MNKKLWIPLGVATAGITAFAVGVAVPIATKDHPKTWSVQIANNKGARYTLTKLDVQQNKSALTGDKQVWDQLSESAIKDDIATLLGVTDSGQIQTAIPKSKAYRNGLEKLIYDLTINFEQNADALSLVFPDGTKVDLADIAKAHTQAKRETAVLAALTSGDLKNNIVKIYQYHPSAAAGARVSLTTADDIKEAANHVLGAGSIA